MHDLSRSARVPAEPAGERPLEVLIVDNNSTDDTRRSSTWSDRSSHCSPCTYLEPRQGVPTDATPESSQAKAPIIAITDDDCRPAADWIASIVRPSSGIRTSTASAGSGRALAGTTFLMVHPLQASPLAMCEHGDEEAVDGGHAGGDLSDHSQSWRSDGRCSTRRAGFLRNTRAGRIGSSVANLACGIPGPLRAGRRRDRRRAARTTDQAVLPPLVRPLRRRARTVAAARDH